MGKSGIAVLILLAAASGPGCSAPPATTADEPELLPGTMVASYRVEAIDNAIIREHTIYPHRFVPGTAQLDPLGQRDIEVLAAHYARHAGTLSIPRGDASPQLYTARYDAVLKALAKAGVASSRVMVSDGLPGGSGLGARWVLIILEAPPGSAAGDGRSTQTVEPALLDQLLMRGSR